MNGGVLNYRDHCITVSLYQCQDIRPDGSPIPFPTPLASRPGHTCSFIIVGRNPKLWRASIDYGDVDSEDLVEMPPSINPKSKYRQTSEFETLAGKAKLVFTLQQDIIVVFN